MAKKQIVTKGNKRHAKKSGKATATTPLSNLSPM